jgi:hypothetical protein
VGESNERLSFLFGQIEEQARAVPFFSRLAEPMSLARRCDLDGVQTINRRAVEESELDMFVGTIFCDVSRPPSRETLCGCNEGKYELGRRSNLNRVFDVWHFVGSPAYLRASGAEPGPERDTTALRDSGP